MLLKIDLFLLWMLFGPFFIDNYAVEKYGFYEWTWTVPSIIYGFKYSECCRQQCFILWCIIEFLYLCTYNPTHRNNRREWIAGIDIYCCKTYKPASTYNYFFWETFPFYGFIILSEMRSVFVRLCKNIWEFFSSL